VGRLLGKRSAVQADANAPGRCFRSSFTAERDGSLHIGHMLDHTEIDISRAGTHAGYNTLYLPEGSRSISTQRVV